MYSPQCRPAQADGALAAKTGDADAAAPAWPLTGDDMTTQRIASTTLTVASLLALAGVASAEPSFSGVGDLPGGLPFSQAKAVSRDGNSVAVYSETTTRREAARWIRDAGLESLGALAPSAFSEAHAMSAMGDVVVGESMSEAFRWTAADGMVGLGDLEGGATFSKALGVSADGDIVVGQSYGLKGPEAFRWTAADGMVGLSDLPGSAFSSIANGVSPDGNVIVGHGFSLFGFEAFKWDDVNGMVGLGDLDGGAFSSTAEDASDNGETIVGRGRSASGNEAFRYSTADGMVGLGDLAGGTFSSHAYAVSGDGSVIVGMGSAQFGKRAVIWRDGATQPELLSDVLANEYGLDVSGWTLEVALDVSDDGMVIVGTGRNPTGIFEGWVADLREEADLIVPDDIVVEVWPPNGKMKSIDIAEVTDIVALNGGSPVHIQIQSITQDEPVLGDKRGRPHTDAKLVSGSVAKVRAERAGWGNGRVYEIAYMAMHDNGAAGEGVVHVHVPHDSGDVAIDDGQTHDSMQFATIGDVDGDDTVSGQDLAVLLANWVEQDPTDGDVISSSDFNMDGRVDELDLRLVLLGMNMRGPDRNRIIREIRNQRSARTASAPPEPEKPGADDELEDDDKKKSVVRVKRRRGGKRNS